MSSRFLPRSTFVRPPRLSSRTIRPIPLPLTHGPRPYSTSTSSSPTPPRIRTTAFLSIAVLTSAYLLYQYEISTSPASGSSEGGKGKSLNEQYGSKFDIRIRTSRNGVQSYEFIRKSEEEVEKILTEHESGNNQVGRKGNPVIRWDTNWVGSNEPCEDRFASNLIPRRYSSNSAFHKSSTDITEAQGEGEGEKDLMLFSIIDGHAGDATSKLLEKTLHPTLSVALAGLQAGYVPNDPQGKSWYDKLNPISWLYSYTKTGSWNPENVTRTLQHAYTELDDHICQSPIKLLQTLKQPSNPSDYPTPRQTLVALAQPAASGACAITTFVDSENQDLYVALAGDCRAVAGWQTKDGKWRCDTLTEDQMGENPKEVERMQKEHPASERDTVIRGGRVQGGLQPTRAFGDAVYKWTTAQGNAIADAFREEGDKPRGVRPWNYTPPYVTARPEVTYRKLKNEDGDQLKFVIMATDGLWDRLTSEESVLLIASYLDHSKHSDISKTELPNLYPLLPSKGERPYPVQDLPQPKDGSWAYEGDTNAATHLIRNSLAGANRKNRAELLSLNGKVSRWMRDDVTCTVVFFGDDSEKKE
ncbi:hypothetical protein I204_08407 [Kwoniella mangroviensis CBS 8886]|uniref:uncharacterized protein n=1 Tax=Kwoniella mangroviensis CBS 8507 TaxID=1296122 RepID=UPI00080D29BF|nr:uncharacterized protein I203_01436 [Kwoniella mangroviensis CBS 8507]OCF69572.1 hypothetical protein I203_01436 [Kwoniella mangroviensis CBS 8507]OCF70972.1 hypothetical protein I204_08407 [Kwoniella mangroviensis CBS 8886]